MRNAFGFGWLVPAVMVVGLVILVLLLLLLGFVKRLLGRLRSRPSSPAASYA